MCEEKTITPFTYLLLSGSHYDTTSRLELAQRVTRHADDSYQFHHDLPGIIPK